MNCAQSWSYDRYLPPLYDESVYICHIVPSANSIQIEYKTKLTGEAKLFYRPKGEDGAWLSAAAEHGRARISELDLDDELEFFVSVGDSKSALGYARTSDVPGTVVNYLHPDDKKYAFSGQHLCTPCLLRHPDGYLMVSMDIFDGGAPQNLTVIFRSDDDGASWYHYTELFPCFWGKLFMHRGDVYMLATSTEYGDLLIGKSCDGGKTFCAPTVLARGSCHSKTPGWHKSSMPVTEHAGRLWTAIDYGAHVAGGHASSLLSASIDSDLTDAQSWVITPPLAYSPRWRASVIGDGRGFIEGNAVATPDGNIANVLRYSTDRGEPRYGLIPILRGDVNYPEKQLSFDKYVAFDGNLSKFDILYDRQSGFYYSLANRVYDGERPRARNILTLMRSPDLEAWENVRDVLDYSHLDHTKVGFQYVSFIFDGNDILFVSRTAYGGAQSFHDNNYVTFHKIQNFRNLKPITQ